MPKENPLITAIQDSFAVKRNKKTGTVPRNWLLIMLCLVDWINEAGRLLHEDDIYTYDFTLKRSRANAIPLLLEKYKMPMQLGMSKEGVTVRGAPGLRVFRALEGGKVMMGISPTEREAMVSEAVGLLRSELILTVAQKPVELSASAFARTGTFVESLLAAVENRSNGRVEQMLVGAKLQLRFPKTKINSEPTFAGDQQTAREADFSIGNTRVIVSATPKDTHFDAARLRADEGRDVFVVVGEKSVARAKTQIRKSGYADRVVVVSVNDYIASNMSELAQDRKLTAEQMCRELAKEYNTRIASDYDKSLVVVIPTE